MKALYLRCKTRIPALIFGILLTSQLFAQQEVMYSQYMFNTLAINPAYAGSRDVLSMTLLGRYQWLGVPGAPNTYSFTMDMPIKNEKMGLGIQAYTDAIGVARNTGGFLSYSYKVKVGAKTTLALGVNGGVENISNLLSDVANINYDPVFSEANNINRLFPNAGAGLFISNDKSYLGISVPHLIENKLSSFVVDNKTYETIQRRHMFAMMGFVIGKGNVKIKPSMMIRYTANAPIGFDGNVNVWFKDKISFGISGRKSQATLSGQEVMDAAVGMIELQLTPQLRLGYAYDYNMTSLNSLSKTGKSKQFTGTPTHEGLLRYEFGYGKSKILTPRYF